MGVGKRTLAMRLMGRSITTADQRHHTEQKTIRMHPLTVGELGVTTPAALEALLDRGGFPAQIWAKNQSKQRSGHIAKPLMAIANSHFPKKGPHCLDSVWEGIVGRVGHLLSIRALASSIGASERAMVASMEAIEAHFGVFRLEPIQSAHFGVSFRGLKKGQKVYPYDWSEATTPKAKLEALVMNHLLAWVESKEDLEGIKWQLAYFRDCDQREVDGVLIQGQQPKVLVQVDPLIDQINPHLIYLHKKFPNAKAWQLSMDGPMTPSLHRGVYLSHPLAFLHTYC